MANVGRRKPAISQCSSEIGSGTKPTMFETQMNMNRAAT
jgi:hypothetical protein